MARCWLAGGDDDDDGGGGDGGTHRTLWRTPLMLKL